MLLRIHSLWRSLWTIMMIYSRIFPRTFCSADSERKEKAESSAGASVEEEPENVILGNISKDPYVDVLYAHKYVNPEGQEIAPLAKVIDSWFDRQKDWTPAPPEIRASWLGEMQEEHPEHTFTTCDRDLFAVRNDKSNVCCWMYDKDKDLYLVKRMNGKLEYFKRPRDFCSMPKFDIRSINNAMFFNPSKDTQADLFAKFLKDQCDRDFPVMKTTKGRHFVSTYNSLANFLSWYFDEKTLAAVILWNKDDIKDIDMILDPMDLLKFGKEDMQKLHESPIRVYGDWDEEAKPFTHVVAFAMEQKLYAGAGPHSVSLPIG
ncbi:hypothetical protein R6Q59_003103 [Mikania micrantha]